MQGKELPSKLHLRVLAVLACAAAAGCAWVEARDMRSNRQAFPKAATTCVRDYVVENMELYFSPSLLGALADKLCSFGALEDSVDSLRAVIVPRSQAFGCPGQRQHDYILPITASACRAALQFEHAA